MNFMKNEAPEKLRGGYYTDHVVARFLAEWAIADGAARILEPSCGDGAFFRALRNLRWGGRSKCVVACELEASEASHAAKAMRELAADAAEMNVGDFLSWFLRTAASTGPFDAVIGNPPFVRYQYLAEHLQRDSERIFARHGLRFTRHTNLWVPFVIASLELLRPGGRLALVVPAEILHVLHAEGLREFLLRECSRVLVLDPEEILFGETLQGVVLLMAEKRSEGTCGAGRGTLAVHRISGRAALDFPAADYFARAAFVPASALGAKWTLALLSSEERRLLAEMRARAGVQRFAQLADVSVGIVTGANSFFLVPDDVVRAFELEPYVYPMFGRSEHAPGVIYDAVQHTTNSRRGLPTNFVLFPADVDRAGLTAGARRYLRNGESEALHTRYKCRIREPWYVVPSLPATPVAMLKRSHDFPRLVLNTAKAQTTDTAYRVTPRQGIAARKLVPCFVNSLTALSCELEGRHYGGGVLELVPSEIARVLVPYVETDADVADLDRMFRTGRPTDAILEAQDDAILGGLGIGRSDRSVIRAAWARLRNRRCRCEPEAVETPTDDQQLTTAPFGVSDVVASYG